MSLTSTTSTVSDDDLLSWRDSCSTASPTKLSASSDGDSVEERAEAKKPSARSSAFATRPESCKTLAAPPADEEALKAPEDESPAKVQFSAGKELFGIQFEVGEDV